MDFGSKVIIGMGCCYLLAWAWHELVGLVKESLKESEKEKKSL